MKMTWPPPQVIFVGFESNQHGQAASQEQASSNWPETFQGAFFSSARAASMPARRRSSTRTVFLRIFSPPFFAAESIPRCATSGHVSCSIPREVTYGEKRETYAKGKAGTKKKIRAKAVRNSKEDGGLEASPRDQRPARSPAGSGTDRPARHDRRSSRGGRGGDYGFHRRQRGSLQPDRHRNRDGPGDRPRGIDRDRRSRGRRRSG